ncbi:GntR family transcriptional regulator [Actinopolyspora erythraea]|uniref:GntR family transcriptional regulator n=2 Tax=Actinopolyspora erythraea TaxID=414996 RepID=A0ABR4X776_9ACTN|nr:PLP-dependent aminotransferase family protein [Actinopolyspora erythraea]KGI82568.1 GntR family transcriptional regulator [Actinopolyspora erythraea]
MDMPEAGRIGAESMARLLGNWSPAGRPSADALHSALRQLVLAGQLPPGTRLPPERELARRIGASRNLVTGALDRLREQGFVRSRRGAGSWIGLPATAGGTADSGGWYPPERGESINFAQATPAPPAEVFEAVERVTEGFPAWFHGHGYQPQGLAELRERVARRFEERGLPTDPDQVMITNGAQHAFALVLRTLLTPGQRVLLEHPTYPNALEAVRGVRALPLPVPMVEGRWDLELLEATLAQGAPRLAYLVPDFHNPTGALMSAAERERLGGALRRHRTTAVVDETLVDIDLSDEEPPPPLAAFAESRTITVGSASKSFWGGLRLGWLRAPHELVQRMVLGRAAIDLGSPVFEQLVLAELLEHADEASRRNRARIRCRRDSLVAALREHLPGWTFTLPEGGLSLWCHIGSRRAGRLVAAAEQRGVRLAPPGRFAVEGDFEDRLRLPYSLPEDRLHQAVRRIAEADGSLNDPGAPELVT